MENPPLPDDESLRLDSLKEMNLLDTPPEERFDRITRIARRVFSCDYSAINLVDSGRQWGKSTCGVDDTEGPREQSFCAHAILEEETTVIPDALEDERFIDNDFVNGPPGIRFYMGHPVHSTEGYPIGTLCVFDSSPRRDVSDEDRKLIKDLASIVDSEFQRDKFHDVQANLRNRLGEAERRSRIDDLTDLWNRRAILEMIRDELNDSRATGDKVGIAMIDIDDFKAVNDTHGHPAGDEVLEQVSDTLRQSVRDYDAVARYGGEEFMVFLTEATREQAAEVGERIRDNVERLMVEHDGEVIDVTVSVGIRIEAVSEEPLEDQLIEKADRALYHAKKNGKNRVCFYSELDDNPSPTEDPEEQNRAPMSD